MLSNECFERVVHLQLDRPAIPAAVARIRDEIRIEIHGRHMLDFPADDAAEKRIATADLKSASATLQHLGNELLAGKGEGQLFGSSR